MSHTTVDVSDGWYKISGTNQHIYIENNVLHLFFY